MQITAIVGNPKPLSKTYHIAMEVVSQLSGLASEQGRSSEQLVIDLADYAGALVQWGNPQAEKLLELAAGADILLFVSPTYKATYTGLLKLFADQIPQNGLAGKIAVPVMVGGSPHHSLAVEHAMRPLLVEMGASCPTKGLYVLDSQFDELPAVVAGWIEQSRCGLSRML
ncbi:NADPH-dependent FMN reductase [Paenibacillus radicis (ex Gao et al. 2016)]|uniref:FMN reductase n=1 Tax=Paenibacillus radicis (ex Gao et al. 2016) TaxID=1737354 RepID=A0A917GYP7_9BACL|nr:NAD(P)H-dependent oxidoreductase [Paenibacillus radicis (ex Gao et al. 2016)]GGG62030.1 FMN reductase [Paenibacillus radicis (ex Gao et al. 2016)]